MRAGNEQVLVDCPDPFFRMCTEASKKSKRKLDPAKFDHIILTHLHGDHCNGLEALGFWRKFHQKNNVPPRLYTSEQVSRELWKRLSAAMSGGRLPTLNMYDQFELRDFFNVAPFKFGDTINVCGIQIETRRTLHPVPTFGFRAEFEGRKFGYSCDTTYDPKLIEFLAPCDLIFHECDKGIHTAQEKLEALPIEIRRKMRLVHLNDDFKPSRKIEAAVEGAVYPV